jgi:antitoxin component YwqK of YwqJK toxin-antitoxin module
VLRQSGEYEYGKKNGTWQSFDQLGKLLSTEKYKFGELKK